MYLGFEMNIFNSILMIWGGIGVVLLALWLVKLLFPTPQIQPNDHKNSTNK
jgi:hypothetical protein